MTETASQRRPRIALVIAAAVAWSTASLFTTLLPLARWNLLFWRGLCGSSDVLGIALACFMILVISAMTVLVRRHKGTPMVAAAALSNLLGSAVSLPFAHDITGVTATELVTLAMFGFCQVGLGLSLFVLGSRHLPSGQATLIGTLETPLMPFWVWLAFQEIPSGRALFGGALVMRAVIADILGEVRAQKQSG